MRKKYKTELDPITGLLRIIALKDFANVKKGDKGGWIEKEENLSQEGDCWVYGFARVYGNATVSGNAQVYDWAQVFGDAKISGRTCIGGNIKISGNVKLWTTTGISWVALSSSITDSKDYIIYVIMRDFYIITLSDLCGTEGKYLKNIQIIRQLYGKEV